MSIQADPAAPWRTIALSDIPVTFISLESIDKLVDEYCAHSCSSWDIDIEEHGVGETTMNNGFANGVITSVSQVADVQAKRDVTSCVTVKYETPYDYVEPIVHATLAHDGDHFAVKPELSPTALNSLRFSPSVREFAKTVNIELPRLVNTGAEGGVSTEALKGFELVRSEVLDRSMDSDYGARLFNLARVVCHSVVRAGLGREHIWTEGLGPVAEFSGMLTAATPLLSLDELRRYCWLYVGAELHPKYRAFLTMGVVGLGEFVAPGRESVYSRCEMEAEQKGKMPIRFVHLSGSLENAAPSPDDYLAVLDNPALATSYYYSYAVSVGLGPVASVVMNQAAIFPFLCATPVVTQAGDVGPKEGRAPYKSFWPPLDACPYLFVPGRTTEVQTYARVQALVGTAAVNALKLLAGYGARILTFDNGSKVRTDSVVAQSVRTLVDYRSARAFMREVVVCAGLSGSGYEWLSPFHPNTQSGIHRSITAFRAHFWSLAQYPTCPVKALEPVFLGCDMRGAVFGPSVTTDQRAALCITQLALGIVPTAWSEAYTQTALPPERMHEAGLFRSWVARYSWVRYTSDDANSVSSVVVGSSPRRSDVSAGVDFGFLNPPAPTDASRRESTASAPAVSGLHHVRQSSQASSMPSEHRRADATRKALSRTSKSPASTARVLRGGMAV